MKLSIQSLNHAVRYSVALQHFSLRELSGTDARQAGWFADRAGNVHHFSAQTVDLPATSLFSPICTLSIWGVCPGPPGQLLICSEDKSVAVYDVSSKTLSFQWHGHQKGVNRVAYLSNASLAVSGSRDTSVRLWSRSATEAVAVLSGHSLPVTGLAPVNHHNQICSGSRDCTLRLWDAATCTEMAFSTISQNLVTSMSAVPAEPAVIQTGEDLHLRLWDTRTMQAVQMLPQHSNIPLCCDVSPDGMYFATSCNGFDGEGCEVCFWDRRQMKQIWQCQGHQQATKACTFLPTASMSIPTAAAAVSNHDNEQEDNAAAAAAETASLLQAGGDVDCDRRMGTESSVLLASASADGTVKVWEMGQDQPVCTVVPRRQGGEPMMTCLAVCSAERNDNYCGVATNLLFAGDFHGHLHSWDVQRLHSQQTELAPTTFV